MLVARNLGYLKQVHSTLNYSRKLAALGRLMAGVAHEVKNPLNAMTIHLELLKQQADASRQPLRCRRIERRLAPPDVDQARRHHRQARSSASIRWSTVSCKFARPDELKLQPMQLAGGRSATSTTTVGPGSGADAASHEGGVSARSARDQRRPGDAAPGAAESRAERLPGDARRRHAAARLPRRRRAGASRSTSKTPASAFRRRTCRGSSICISPPRRGAAASACRWSTGSSSCTTERSRCSRHPARGTRFRLVFPEA